jgi:hypothetical protein
MGVRTSCLEGHKHVISLACRTGFKKRRGGESEWEDSSQTVRGVRSSGEETFSGL